MSTTSIKKTTRRITLTPKQFQFTYEGLALRQVEIVEERSQARLLTLLESLSSPYEITASDGNKATLYRTTRPVTLVLEDDADFKLLKRLNEISRPAGMFVRTKHEIEELFDSSKKE